MKIDKIWDEFRMGVILGVESPSKDRRREKAKQAETN